MSCASSSSITLRPESAEDEPLLLELYAATRADEMAATGWNSGTCAAFVRMQFRAQREGYRNAFPRAAFSMILADARPIGRLVVNRVEEEIRLIDIALLASHQGQGIGTQLLRQLCAEAASGSKAVRLHTLPHSRARRLYERLGFHPVGETDVYQQMEWRANTGPG